MLDNEDVFDSPESWTATDCNNDLDQVFGEIGDEF